MVNGPAAKTTTRRRRGAVALLAGLACTALAVPPAAAAPTKGAQASYAITAVGKTGALLLRGTPGEVERGAVLVRNTSRRRVTVQLRAADIGNASNGNADYRTSRVTGAGRWLRLATRTVHLAPRASRRVSFTVRIPRSAAAGSHYAGIVGTDAREVAVAARKPAKGKRFAFNRVTRQALPVTVRLPGRLWRELDVRSVRIDTAPAGAGLMLRLRPGGSSLTAGAPVELRVSRGDQVVLRHAAALGQLFPGSDLDYRIAWPGEPTAGDYRVVGVIRPEGAKAVRIDTTVRFTAARAKAHLAGRAIPPVAAAPAADLPDWLLAAVIAAGALFALMAFALWRARRRDPDARADVLA